MTYNNCEVYYNKDNEFEKAIFSTSVGRLEIIDESIFNTKINEFARQERLSVDDLLNKDNLIKKFKSNKNKTKKNKIEKMTSDQYYNYVLRRKKNSGLVKGLAITTSIAVLAGGIWVISKLAPGRKTTDDFKIPTKNQYTIEQNTGTSNDLIDDNEVALTPSYTGINSVNSGSSNGSEYDKVMSGVINREQENNQIISQLVTGNTVELSNEEILQAINDNSRSANSSIFEVSQYINDRGLHGTAYYCSFEKLFTPGTVDYNAVKMFSDMRNDIVKTVFQSKNKTAAISKIDAFYNLYTEFVMVGPCKFTLGNQSYVINYNDLSDMAKATILEIGSAMFTIDLDYTYNDGKYKFKKDEIYNDSVSMLEGELLPRLINKSYHK